MTNSTATRRPWTDEEIGYMSSSWDRPLGDIAATLGRTVASVQKCRTKLKRGWEGPRYAPWLTHEDALLLATPHVSSQELANQLPGRTKYSVSWRRRHIGAVVTLGRRNMDPFTQGSRFLVARTCLGCGLLLPGSWFPIMTKKNLQAYSSGTCRKCRSDMALVRNKKNAPTRPTNKSSLIYKRRAQAVTAALAENNGNEYTEADHEILADPTISTLRKALILKRTYAAVGTIMQDMGYKSTAGRLTDPELAQWVIDNPNAKRIDEIMAILQQPEDAEAESIHPEWDWDD